MTKRPSQGYEFLEHTTDALIEAWGSTIEQAFAQAGRALFDTMLHIDKVKPAVEETIQVTGHDQKELLYNWLEELLLQFEIKSMACSSFEITHMIENATGVALEAKVRGEAYDRAKHGSKTEVKGITYHLMEISEEPGEVRVRFLLDL